MHKNFTLGYSMYIWRVFANLKKKNGLFYFISADTTNLESVRSLVAVT